jgi:hypothetical protein
MEDMADFGVDLEEEKKEEGSADLDSERADEEEEVGLDSFLWGLVEERSIGISPEEEGGRVGNC